MKRYMRIAPLLLVLGILLMGCGGQDPVATNPTGENPSGSAKGKAGTRIEACDGSIGDFVWLDLNGDGKWESGEPGLPGVKITLTLYGVNTFVAETTTDVNGNYQFTGLCPNTYAVTYTTPTGLCPDPQCGAATDDNTNNTNHCNGLPVTTNLVPVNNNVDFGFTVCTNPNLGL